MGWVGIQNTLVVGHQRKRRTGDLKSKQKKSLKDSHAEDARAEVPYTETCQMRESALTAILSLESTQLVFMLKES